MQQFRDGLLELLDQAIDGMLAPLFPALLRGLYLGEAIAGDHVLPEHRHRTRHFPDLVAALDARELDRIVTLGKRRIACVSLRIGALTRRPG